MKPLLTLRLEIILGMVLALTSAVMNTYAQQIAISNSYPVASTPISPSPAPYKTLEGVWMVRVIFHQASPPEIIKVKYLSAGRISVFPAGDEKIQVLDSQGAILYEQALQIVFLAGDPPAPVNSREMVMMVPHLEDDSQLRVLTTQGEAIYDLPDTKR